MSTNPNSSKIPQPTLAAKGTTSADMGSYSGIYERSPGEQAMEFFKDYARERPEVIAMWAFGIGFVLGWKLKPW